MQAAPVRSIKNHMES